jgi:hypothetical protein
MDPSTKVDELGREIAQLPSDALENFLRLNTRRTRLALVPAYRHETLFGQFSGCFYPYLLHSSGDGVTDSSGQATIDIAAILRCVASGEPIHEGVHPFANGQTSVPGVPTMIGAPITVVTGEGDRPKIFSVSNPDQKFVTLEPVGGVLNLSWQPPAPLKGTQADEVLISSFAADGDPAPGARFHWHTSIELIFAVASS